VTDEPSQPESLDDTYRRLSPYGPPAGGVPQPPEPPSQVWVAPQPLAPQPLAAQPLSFEPPIAPVRSRSTGATLAIVAASLAMVLVIAGMGGTLAALSRSYGPPTNDQTFGAPQPTFSNPPDPVDAWTDYPGSAYLDSADVLANPSMETVTSETETLIEDYKAQLTAALGVEWSSTYDGRLEKASNGYDGDSMLYDYSSVEWQGVVVLDDPTARQTVTDIFATITDTYGAGDSWFSNEIYDDDAEASKKQFGAATVDEQPMWTLYALDTIAPGSTLATRMLDTNLPRDPSFDGDYWFELGDVPAGSFVVTISFTDYGLLSDADRDAFTTKLGEFDESAKPEGR
jgi:hypothetical protein